MAQQVIEADSICWRLNADGKRCIVVQAKSYWPVQLDRNCMNIIIENLSELSNCSFDRNGLNIQRKHAVHLPSAVTIIILSLNAPSPILFCAAT